MTTNIVRQRGVNDLPAGTPPSRHLQQQNLVPIQIALTVVLDYRTQSTEEYNPVVWISDAFNSEQERTSYIQRLQQRNPGAFQNVVSVFLTIDGFVPIEEPLTTAGGTDFGIGVIVGSVVVGVVLLALTGLYFSRRGDKYHVSRSEALKTASVSQSAGLGYTAEIVVDRQDDISTLGDPVVGMGGMLMMNSSERDERTASVVDDYDYAKEYLLGQGTMEEYRDRYTSADSAPSGKTSQTPFTHVSGTAMMSSVFADDSSFEEQFAEGDDAEEKRFEVQVPPGKLGMVIDTPNGGVPVVHAIKPESVLANKVKVGDRLISVDGEDVTTMTAVQVSKLISIKSNKQRVLVFVRMNLRDQTDFIGR